MAFMPRHGDDHELPPHGINYRANVWAMREVGVRGLSAPAPAARSSPTFTPGTFVVADQFVDRTRGRADTFYDGRSRPRAAAEPYCPELRRCSWQAAALGIAVADGGTVVVIQGPRFSTRAGRAGSARGLDRGEHDPYPEAWLARELSSATRRVALSPTTTSVSRGCRRSSRSAPGPFPGFRREPDRLRDLFFRACRISGRSPKMFAPPLCPARSSTRGGTSLEQFLDPWGSIVALACGGCAVLYGIVTSRWLLAMSPGNEEMQPISAAVQEGAKAYLTRQYTIIAGVAVVIAMVHRGRARRRHRDRLRDRGNASRGPRASSA